MTRRPNPIDRFGGKNPERVDPADETIVVAVRLPARTVRALDAYARTRGQTRSSIAREILTRHAKEPIP
jgi:hypothetical protein